MPFVQGKCDNCGGILTVDLSLKAANCPFCGTAYVVQDSINNYNTSIKVESMHADVVNVVDENSSEARLKAGAAYLKIGKYDLAEKEYQFVTKMAPQNNLGWLGLIEARTNNYSKRIKSASELKALNECALSVSTLSQNGSGNALIEKWTNYLKNEEERNAAEKAPIAKALTDYANQIKSLFNESKDLTEQIEQNEKRLSFLTANNKLDKTNPAKAAGCFLGVGLLLSPIGLMLLIASIALKDTSTLPVAIPMLMIGSVALFGAIRERSKLNKSRNEVKSISEDLDKLKSRMQEINNQMESIQTILSSAQKQLNEYL